MKKPIKCFWKYIFNTTKDFIGPMGAALTTWLLHDNRKISQALNLANSINRAAFGVAFRMSSTENKNKIIIGIWKILTNTSYIVTTLDVNTDETIFQSHLDSLSLEIPNKTPFSLFEISAISGVISGILDIVLIFGNDKLENHYLNILEKSQNVFDFMCPSFAFFGGISLGFIPEISWNSAAPYAAAIDGIVGVLNFWDSVAANHKLNMSKEKFLPPHATQDDTNESLDQQREIAPLVLEQIGTINNVISQTSTRDNQLRITVL